MPLSLLPAAVLGEPLHRSFDRRALLPLLPDQVWQIQQGIVRTVTWTGDGEMIVLGIWGAGDLVGQPLSAADPHQAECLTLVKATPLTADRWHQETAALVEHIQHTEKLLEIMRSGSASIVLLRLLVWLAQRFGDENQGNLELNFHVTHQELAETTGLTRVTITRLLRSFEKQGLIQRHGRQIVVLPESEPFWHYEI